MRMATPSARVQRPPRPSASVRWGAMRKAEGAALAATTSYYNSNLHQRVMRPGALFAPDRKGRGVGRTGHAGVPERASALSPYAPRRVAQQSAALALTAGNARSTHPASRL